MSVLRIEPPRTRTRADVGVICSYRLLPDQSCLLKYDVRMRTAPNTQGILDS